MTIYTATFSSTIACADKEFEAATPEAALEMARAYDPSCLDWQTYELSGKADEIEIGTEAEEGLAIWQSEGLRLQLAAPALLEALEQALVALNTAPRFKVSDLDSDSYRCQSALNSFQGRASKTFHFVRSVSAVFCAA
jgi:hypothetical protein